MYKIHPPDFDIVDLDALSQRLDQRLSESALRANNVDTHAFLGVNPMQHQWLFMQLRQRLQQLQILQAPLFIEEGHGLRVWLKRLANLPIRALSSKQVIHNRELLNLISLLLSELERSYIRDHTAALSAEQTQRQIDTMQDTIAAMHKQLSLLEAALHQENKSA